MNGGNVDADHRDLLEPFVTNLDDQVFAIKNLQGMVGAIMARYSRAETGLRETLLREFIKEDQLNLEKASSLIDRVLIAYGDDSVGELEGSHLSLEGISMLATKEIEHRRIGGSPIEQSTRYVRYDFRGDDGKFPYIVPNGFDAQLNAEYIQVMDQVFTGYGQMWDPLISYLKTRKPIDEATYDVRGHGHETRAQLDNDHDRKNFARTYRMDIKTKACDVLRGFLPLATKANVGLFGNGRFFQHLISKLLSSPYPEAVDLGERALTELSKVIPHYVKRAKRMTYMCQCRDGMKAIVASLGLPTNNSGPISQAIEPDHEFMADRLAASDSVTPAAIRQASNAEMDLSLTASMVFPYANCSFTEIRSRLAESDDKVWYEIWDAYYGDRKMRRDRPERGIEFGYPHNLEMVTEWGVYKDLMRHRMGTIQYQELQPNLGFQMPEEIIGAGLQDMANQTIEHAESLYATLAKKAPGLQAYAFLQGHRMRWMVSMNDRALLHMLELRTTVQGHPNYRRACQSIHQSLEKRFPQRSARMCFVNHDPAYWSRGDSEARQRLKENQLDGNQG